MGNISTVVFIMLVVSVVVAVVACLKSFGSKVVVWPISSRLQAGMMASHLNHREHLIPALTDHLVDEAG